MPQPVRVVALLCGLLALGLRVWQTLWLWPRTGALLWMLALIGGLAAPIVLFFVVTGRFAKRGRRMVVDPVRRRFVVPGSARLMGLVSILIMANAGACAVAFGDLALSAVGVFLFVVIAWWLLYTQPVYVVFDAHSIRVRQFFSREEMLWEQVGSVTPRRFGGGLNVRTRPPLNREIVVPARLLQADPAWLRAVVEQYAAHPDRRAAIGTPQEMRRLGTLASPDAAPGHAPGTGLPPARQR